MTEGAAERVTGAEAVEDRHRERRDLGRRAVAVDGEDALGALFDDGEFDARLEEGLGRRVRFTDAGGDLDLVEVADGDGGVAQGLGVEGPGGVLGLFPAALFQNMGRQSRSKTVVADLARWASAASVAVRLGSSLRPVPQTRRYAPRGRRPGRGRARRSPGPGPWAAGRAAAGKSSGGKISQNVTGVGSQADLGDPAVVHAKPRGSPPWRYAPKGSSPVRVITAVRRPSRTRAPPRTFVAEPPRNFPKDVTCASGTPAATGRGPHRSAPW